MPYGYGSANKGSSGKQHQPKTKAKHSPHGGGPGTGYVPPKKKTSTWTPGAGGKQHIPKKKTKTVTTGGGPSPGITHPFLRNKNIKKSIFTKKAPYTWKHFVGSMVNPWALDETELEGEGDMTLETRGLQKGLSDYMFGKGITSLQNLPESAKVWMAHSPKPDDFAKIAKEGFTDIRPTSRWSNLLSPRSYEQLLKGNNPLKSTGVYTAVGKTEKEAMEAAAKFGKGAFTRGVGSGVDASKIFTAQVPRSTFPIHSGVLRTPQMEVPSSFANKYFGIGDKGLKVGAAPAKGMIKSTVGRMLPGVGAALGGASALKHLQAGNYGQAAMAGLSMVPGPVGWAGLGGELALGALQNAKQIPNWQATRKYANGGLIDFYRYGGFI